MNEITRLIFITISIIIWLSLVLFGLTNLIRITAYKAVEDALKKHNIH